MNIDCLVSNDNHIFVQIIDLLWFQIRRAPLLRLKQLGLFRNKYLYMKFH